jgi:2-methylcitrate dehydratase PrpD
MNKHNIMPLGLNRLNRRDLFQKLAGTSAILMLPTGANADSTKINPVMNKLSTYMANAGASELPQDIAEATKDHILDTFGAMLSGSRLTPGVDALRFAKFLGGERISSVAASNILLGPIDAATINGVLANADETDDNYSTGGAHPGCAILSAALALGEQQGTNGTRFIRAVALGYDVGMRAFKVVSEGGVLAETHNVVGTFGAAAATACVARLNANQMRTVIDYASQQAGGGIGVWRQDTQHVEKSFMFGGLSSRNGITATMLVMAGCTGVNDVFSGSGNFFESYAPNVNQNIFVDNLGKEYEVMNTIIKKWPTGGPIQSPLDAIYNIRQRHPFKADDVKEVVVHVATSAYAKVNNSAMANLSLQYMVALMTVDNIVSFYASHDESLMNSPVIVKEMAKISVVSDADLERLLPKRVAIVEVTFNDGTKIIERNDTVRGSPEDPMSRNEVISKAIDLIVPIIGKSKAYALVDQIYNLEQISNIQDIRSNIQIE